MNQTKIIALSIALALVAVAAIGVAFAQVVNTQNQAYINTQSPAPQQDGNGYYIYVPSNGTYVVPCYPYGGQIPDGAQQGPNAYYGYRGWGCGRFW
jgi:protein-disulfide isomerase